MMRKKTKNPELLAPAGSPSCALAAFEAGADAIYAGLSKFNARERGENFTAPVMAQIVDYAHKLGRRVYVTLNTLIKETELPEVARILAELEEIAPDGVLVQDLGVLRMAREYFPSLVLHGSTQMGFHNAPGMKIAEELGLRRVVLERQLTMEEIASIRHSTKLELEVFIHGALCASLSGQCFFSSYLGGYSGNRGKCKQPCRRRYFSRNGNGFFFSPQDLCSIEFLPRLRELGIESLKIEGRLKQPDYVRQTVAAYRMLLDAPEEEFAEHLSEARNLLGRSCGRRWSAGFFTRESTRMLIQHDSLGAAGMLCGTVAEIRSNGFAFRATRRLFLGDRLRVQPQSGDEGPALTLTKMFVNDASARRVLPGEEVFVCCDKPVPPRGLIFKIGESFSDYSKALAALPPRRIRLDLEVKLTGTELTVDVLNAPLPAWHRSVALAEAAAHPVSEAVLEKEFQAADSECFALGKFSAKIAGNFFLPASEGKALRREFWEFVKNNLKPEAVFRSSAVGMENFRRAYQALVPHYTLPERLIETVAMKPDGAEPANRRAVRADSIYDFNKRSDEVLLPEFCVPERVESLRRAIASAYAAGIRRFRVTSLYALELLRGLEQIEILISTPLPVCNSMAALELTRFGATRVMAHLELERASIEALRDKSPLPVELYRFGRPVLLISRARIPLEGDFRDGRSNEFQLRTSRRDGMARVYPRKVHSVPRLTGVYDYYDLTNAHWKADDTGTFNFNGDWF